MVNIKEEIMENITKKKLTQDQLRRSMKVKGESDIASFLMALNSLEEAGKIYLDSDGYYKEFDIKQLNKVQGQIHISKTGNGFVHIKTDTSKMKYVIKAKDLNGALEGDIVVLNNLHHGNINYGDADVEKVIKRNKENAVFEYNDGQLTPYSAYGNITVLCPKEELQSLVDGNRVLVKVGKDIMAQIDEKNIFEGHIVRIIGHKDDPQIEVETIAANHGFVKEFPKAVIEQLKTIPTKVREEDLEGRVDLRQENIFTIDGKDTKDMDDAVSISIDENNNYILKVHIADVSHYVKENTPLYKEARLRGTSAYLSDSVIPMLPHQLSNGICSLNEGKNRLTKTVEMTINHNGKIIDYDIYDSVIKSKKKMNYDDVNLLLEQGIMPKGYEKFAGDLLIMRELAQILNDKRKNGGKVDFCSEELKIVEAPNGDPLEFIPRKQKTGEKIIENFMIAANETVTVYHSYLQIPFVYRVHGDPHEDSLINTLKEFKDNGMCPGTKVDALINHIVNGNFHSRDLNEFIESFREDPNYPIISSQILRSMSKAKYSPQNTGHYGLALKYYTHFTSPIRRFPDLEVHYLTDLMKTYGNISDIKMALPDICQHSSEMEREADAAENDVLALKMAEYMKPHIGEYFKGRITRMTPFGMKIKLQNNVEGIVYPEDVIKSKENGKSRKFKLGEPVYALVKDVSIPHRLIIFEISRQKEEKPKTKKLK